MTPYHKTGTGLSAKNFKIGERKNHALRDGPFSYDFYHDVLENSRQYAIEHNFTLSYQVVVYAKDKISGRELSLTVQQKTRIDYDQDDYEVFESFIDDVFDKLNKSSTDFVIRFMRIILIAEKGQKRQLDEQRLARAEKQKQGRAAAKHEKELLAKEEAQRKARRTRELNLERQAQGLPKIKPQRKSKKKFIK